MYKDTWVIDNKNRGGCRQVHPCLVLLLRHLKCSHLARNNNFLKRHIQKVSYIIYLCSELDFSISLAYWWSKSKGISYMDIWIVFGVLWEPRRLCIKIFDKLIHWRNLWGLVVNSNNFCEALLDKSKILEKLAWGCVRYSKWLRECWPEKMSEFLLKCCD